MEIIIDCCDGTTSIVDASFAFHFFSESVTYQPISSTVNDSLDNKGGSLALTEYSLKSCGWLLGQPSGGNLQLHGLNGFGPETRMR